MDSTTIRGDEAARGCTRSNWSCTQSGWRTWLTPIAALAMLTSAGAALAAEDAAKLEFFEKKVRPLLVNNCYNCHSADNKAAGDLRVDDRNGLLAGGKRGSGVVPGDPDKSNIIKAVKKTDDKLKMPPDYDLEPEQIAILEQWIADGAVWPVVELSDSQTGWVEDYDFWRENHWAWQALQASPTPDVANTAWPRSNVDRWILATLEGKGFAPVGDADKLSLLRRVTYDLTGLPPTPEAIAEFLADSSAQAFETVVDRLLDSPAFGERWGRHWLDVARYGDSTGSSRNVPYPHAWRYRDYVIRAFNSDKPYNQFLLEQIAGDLLPAVTAEQRDEQLIATGFLAIGVKDVNQRFKVRFIMDNIDEQIDTLTRSTLALTVSCARCHNHKFDPIPATDYYALAGIFESTDHCAGLRNQMGGGGMAFYVPDLLVKLSGAEQAEPSAEQQAKIEAAKKEFEQAKAEFEQIRGTPEGLAKGPNGQPKQQQFRQKMNRKQQDLEALSDPAAMGLVAHGLRDSKTIRDTEIRIRGEAEKLGPVAPRGFLSLLQVPDARPINPEQSGRLELAHWIASDQNPLTSRVIVNRVWQHLFGEGLVRSVDNFGITGESPTHPELLDQLAIELVHDGWSLKRLVRRLVLTRTYQLSAESSPTELAADPQNRWLWRHTPRRLDAEEIRDAMLSIAGNLDAAMFVPTVAKELQMKEIRNNGAEAAKILAEAESSRSRSIYLPLVRTLVPPALEVFDFAEQGMVTGRRDQTTVAPQALFLLNAPFVIRQSQATAARLLADEAATDAERLDRAFRAILNRSATAAESERLLAYLEDYAGSSAALFGDQPVAKKAVAKGSDSTEEDNATSANQDDKVQPVVTVSATGTPRPANPRHAAWSSVVQALFATAEFRYLP